MHDAPPALHGAMKAATKAAPTGSPHSYTHPGPYQTSSISRSSHSHRSSRGGSSTTPLASPRAGPFSVGQNHAPKLSPGRGPEARAPSPNYFGLVVEASNSQDSSLGRNKWSPSSSSSVKSFGAAIPTQVPHDANSEFEAFKRQVDFNKSRQISLPPGKQTSHAAPTSNSGPQRPQPPRWHTHTSYAASDMSFARSMSSAHNKMDVDQGSLHDSAYVSADSKRNSESSLFPLQLPGNTVRFESPAPMEQSQQRVTLTRAEDRDPRLSMMEHKADPPSPPLNPVSRAATLPTNPNNGAPAMILGDELKEMVKSMKSTRLLLLDIRSAQNYAQSRISGALNLCIPTTLLKRATFNIQKLQQTFQGGSESNKFAKWREADAIVVYDSHSSDQRDAVTAQNMIKKFTNEGYSGKVCILKGGFTVFKESYAKLVETGPPAGISSKSSCNPCDGIAPVIGGVSLPMTTGATNPFFSNIRQNMDLADGVGQFDVARPAGLQSPQLPNWLRNAAAEPDKGKQVSEKFLKIEKEEKSRMQTAYAAFNPNTAQQKQSVQLCGVEKGGKNRYKDILPFEHARVKLQNKSSNGNCDYVNASHLRSSRSNKRYIASQGPLPATFEDFWSVVWEQDVRVVVMLTAESEGGQLKCHPYWKQRDHGPFRLKPLSEKKASLDTDKHRTESSATASFAGSGDFGRKRANTTTTSETSTPTPKSLHGDSETPYVIIRKFALSHAAQPFAPIREITHLHFSSWPDFGTPAQPSHLLALVELANVMQRSALPVTTESIVGSRPLGDSPMSWNDEPERDAHSRPMMVHCSAGCGRTGTFVAVDSVIDMLKRKRNAKSLRNMPDAEGDVEMGDVGASPRTNKFPRTSSHHFSARVDEGPGAGTIDTTYLRDDSVDLISETVEDLREQRLSMVQSLRQFVLCYETILEWVHRVNNKGADGLKGRGRAGSLVQQRR